MRFEVFARMKLRQARGAAWLQFVLNLSILMTALKVWESSFVALGIPMGLVYIGVACGWIGVTTGIGFIDEFWGIWKSEATYSTNMLNPVLSRMAKQVEEIEKRTRG